MDLELNFDALEKMNIPPIESVMSKPEVKPGGDKEEEQVLEIKEVESIDELEDESSESVETQVDDDLDKPSDNKDDDPVKQIALWQQELGLIDFEEEEYTKAEDKEEFFKQRFEDKVKKAADASLHPVIKELNEKFREGVPLDELIGSKSEEMRLSSITEDVLKKDENLQEMLVKQMLKMSGWDDEEIKDEIETYKDSNKLEMKSKKALEKLIVNEKNYQEQLEKEAVQNKERQTKEYQESLKKLNDTIMKAETFIDGIKMTNEDKEKLYNSIVKRDKDGYNLFEKKLMDNPNLQFAFAQFVLQLDGKFDKLTEIAKTKTSKDLKKSVDTYSDKQNKKTKLDLAVVREAVNKSRKTF